MILQELLEAEAEELAAVTAAEYGSSISGPALQQMQVRAHLQSSCLHRTFWQP
jgi:hypothetical protein